MRVSHRQLIILNTPVLMNGGVFYCDKKFVRKSCAINNKKINLLSMHNKGRASMIIYGDVGSGNCYKIKLLLSLLDLI